MPTQPPQDAPPVADGSAEGSQGQARPSGHGAPTAGGAAAEGTGSVLGQRPPDDAMLLEVARSRIANALFATEERVRIGRYQLLARAGAGGMGVVWSAWDPELDRRVAIKLMHAQSAAAREILLREGQALARLSHPNIVPIYDVGTFEDQVYLVIEWIAGTTVRDHCRQRRAVRDLLAIYQAAGAGVAAAHRAGIVHRDLKPDNVMVGDDGRVRVLDFGLAHEAKRAEAAHDDAKPAEAAHDDAKRAEAAHGDAKPAEAAHDDAKPAEAATTGGTTATDAAAAAPATDAAAAAPAPRRAAAAAAAVAGTPRYMAPEQARGHATTAASDQYSFAVSLRESLATAGPVPAWIDQVLERATAVAPEARYPDMDALLAALARDPARRWRRRAALAAALLALVAAFIVGARQQRAGVEACSGAEAELAAAWSPERRDALAANLAPLGPYGASQAETLAAQLARHGERWIAARRGACVAQRRGELTPALYERGLACLERARSALDAVVTTLTRAPLARLPEAVLAARNLPAAERCVAEATTDPVAPPPAGKAARVSAIDAQVTRARYLALAADPDARELALAAVRDAEATAYPPLLARAQIALGAALALVPGSPTVAAYATAADAALAGGDDVAFVEAFARQLFAASQRGEPSVPQLVAALPFVTTIARRTGDAGGFARTLLYNNAATERLAVGDRAAALAWLRKARAEPLPAERAAELWLVLGNLAMLVPDRAEREALFSEERAQLERTLGAEHAFTFAARVRAALAVEDAGQAAARLAELCPAYQRLHPHKRDDLAACFYELAWLRAEAGHDDDARRAYASVAALEESGPGANAARGVLARAELARLAGDPAAALALAEPLARARERDPKWWSRIPAADAWLVAAAARQARGDLAGAVAAWRAARRVSDELAANTQATTVLRHRARAGALLALATRDRQLADDAIAWYRSAGGYHAAIAALSW